MSTTSNLSSDRRFIFYGAISMLIAVAAGAFAAHGLKHSITNEMLAIYRTAVEYQVYHSLGLILIGIILKLSAQHDRGIIISGWLMLAGIIIFSGSLYALSLSGVRWLGAITPIGGLCFLAAWWVLAWRIARTKGQNW